MNNEELLAKYKALFPDNVEAIVVRKDDYDRLYGDITLENIELKQEIERLHSIIKEVREYIENNDIMKVSKEENTKGAIFCDTGILEILDKDNV